jgi:hypothetical protein
MQADKLSWNFFKMICLSYIDLNGVVVMILETCTGGPGSNPFIVTNIYTQASTI